MIKLPEHIYVRGMQIRGEDVGKEMITYEAATEYAESMRLDGIREGLRVAATLLEGKRLKSKDDSCFMSGWDYDDAIEETVEAILKKIEEVKDESI